MVSIYWAIKTVSYSPFNTPSITQGNKFSTLVYGPNQERIKHSDSNGRVTKYVGGIYEEVTKAGVTQKIHYVGDFALVTQTGGVTPVIKHEYLHRDHIGSIVAISKSTVASANDVQWQSNGAWGERRYQQWNGPLDNLLNPDSTAKGFTDHEHLDAVGLIHMNGRVYDPELGRFMSTDPFVQAPYNSQSYNRYSYVFNNPLSFTDPSGYQSCQITEFFNATDSQTGEHLGTWSQTRQGASGNGTFCGQDAYNFGQDLQNQQQRYIDYSQLPMQMLGAPHYAQGQHLLDQNAKVLQAEIVFGATTFIVSGEAIIGIHLANNAKRAEELKKIADALKSVDSDAKGLKNLTDRLGSRELNKLVQSINKGKIDRESLTPEQRKIAADFFREAAKTTSGKYKKATAEFNKHRADFLEGLTDEVPGTAQEFMARRGLTQ